MLTRTDLNTAVNAILKDLSLTTRCCDISSSYADYIVMQFFVGRPTERDAATIRTRLTSLATACGWKVPRATVHYERNSIAVIWEKSDVISTGDARLRD